MYDSNYVLGLECCFKENYLSAFEAFKKSNHIQADYMIGVLYENGFGVERNIVKATKYYLQTQKKGDQQVEVDIKRLELTAQQWLEVGEDFYFGRNDVNKNYTIALSCYQYVLKIQRRHIYAHYSLGWIYQYGQGIPISYADAKYHFSVAANQGHELSKKQLLILDNPNFTTAEEWNRLGLQYNDEIEPDRIRERLCYVIALTKDPDHKEANCNLGLMYLWAQNVNKNLTKAKFYCEKVLSKHADCNEAITLFLRIENEGNNKSADEWVNLGRHYTQLDCVRETICYQLALEEDDKNFSANYYLGLQYYHGLGITKNLNTAKSYFEKTLIIKVNHEGSIKYLLQIEHNKLESADEWNRLGLQYDEATPEKKTDRIRERLCYEVALSIEPDHKNANCNLGLMYLWGQSVNKDIIEAKKYCEKVLNLNANYHKAVKLLLRIEDEDQDKSADEWNILGTDYYYGIKGKKKSSVYERCCYELALVKQNNYYKAYYNLSLIYSDGRGVKLNLEKANYYYQKAKRYCKEVLDDKADDEIAIKFLLRVENNTKNYSADDWNKLGGFYEKGNAEKFYNHVWARCCYKLALELNNKQIEANRNLSWIYFFGLGVTKDIVKALYYSEQALAGCVNQQEKDNNAPQKLNYNLGASYYQQYKIIDSLPRKELCRELALQYNIAAYSNPIQFDKRTLKEIELRIAELKFNNNELIEKDVVDIKGNKGTLLHFTAKNRSLKNCARLMIFGAKNDIPNTETKMPFGCLANQSDKIRITNLESQIRRERQILKTDNESVVSILMKAVNGNDDDKRKLKGAIEKSNENNLLRPLLKLAKFSAYGCHRLSGKKKFDFKNNVGYDSDDDDLQENLVNISHQLSIEIDSKNSTIDYVMIWGKDGLAGKNAAGVYMNGYYYNNDKNKKYYDSAIYIAGDQSEKNFRGTFIHELTHFLAREVFNNNCKPYFMNDKDIQCKFEKIANNLENNRDILPVVLKDAFLKNYKNNGQVHEELIVRIPQLLLVNPDVDLDNDFNGVVKPLFAFYKNEFLYAVNNHIQKLESIVFKDLPDDMYKVNFRR